MFVIDEGFITKLICSNWLTPVLCRSSKQLVDAFLQAQHSLVQDFVCTPASANYGPVFSGFPLCLGWNSHWVYTGATPTSKACDLQPVGRPSGAHLLKSFCCWHATFCCWQQDQTLCKLFTFRSSPCQAHLPRLWKPWRPWRRPRMLLQHQHRRQWKPWRTFLFFFVLFCYVFFIYTSVSMDWFFFVSDNGVNAEVRNGEKPIHPLRPIGKKLFPEKNVIFQHILKHK